MGKQNPKMMVVFFHYYQAIVSPVHTALLNSSAVCYCGDDYLSLTVGGWSVGDSL